MASYNLRSNTIYALIGGITIGVLGLSRTFWVAHALTPVDFGEWSLLQLFLVYGGFCHFGVAVAMPNEIVAKEAHNDTMGSRTLAQAGLLLILGSSAVFSVICLVLPGSIIGNTLLKYRFLFAITFLAQQFFLHVSALLRAHLKFQMIALGQVIFGVGSLILMAFLLPPFGVRGALLSMLISNLAAACVGAGWVAYYGFNIHISKRAVRFLFLAGLPLLLSALIGTALQNIDRVLISRLLGKESLGYYSVSNVFVMPVMFLPSVLGGLLMTHFARAAVIETSATIRTHLLRFSWAVAVALAVVTACIYILIDPIFLQYIPKYTRALPTVKILVVGTYFYASTLVLANFLIANKRQGLLLIVQGLALLLLAICCFIAIHFNLGFEGVGWANLVSYVIYFLFLLIVATKIMNWPFYYIARLILAYILPILFMSLMLLIFNPFQKYWFTTGIFCGWFLAHFLIILTTGGMLAFAVYRLILHSHTTS